MMRGRVKTPIAAAIKNRWDKVAIFERVRELKDYRELRVSRQNAYHHMRMWEREGLSLENCRAKVDMLRYLEQLTRESEARFHAYPEVGWAETFAIKLHNSAVSKMYSQYSSAETLDEKKKIASVVSLHENEIENLKEERPSKVESYFNDPNRIRLKW